MRVIVCGGRDFWDEPWLVKNLNAIHYRKKITELFHGNTRGTDRMAGRWAAAKKIPVQVFPAQWEVYGRRAGPIRNRVMLDTAIRLGLDAVIAFPGSTGTQNMIDQARMQGVKVIEVR